MLAIARFLYVLVLPVAGCAVLAAKGSHPRGGWILFIVIAIFIYHYLQAALIVTERRSNPGVKDFFFGIVPVMLVGLSASFAWQNWIVEQMFLEAGAFSLGVALLAMRKGVQEGRQAPWALIVIIFLLPASVLVFFAGQALFQVGGLSNHWVKSIAIAVAMIIAVGDTVRRLYPYVIGDDQLAEPIQKGWQMAFAIFWMIALLVGIPFLLRHSG